MRELQCGHYTTVETGKAMVCQWCPPQAPNPNTWWCNGCKINFEVGRGKDPKCPQCGQKMVGQFMRVSSQ